MAAVDVLVISSTPAAPKFQCGLSPSPISPASCFARPRPTLKSGSRASQIPSGAPLGFRSAKEVAQVIEAPAAFVVDLTTDTTIIEDEVDCDATSASSKDPASKKKTKKRLDDGESESDKNIVSRKPKATKDPKAEVAVDDITAKYASKSKKPRAKPQKASEKEQNAGLQSKLTRNVTKIGATTATPAFKRPSTLRNLETIADDVATGRAEGNSASITDNVVDLELGWERDTGRRQSWTTLQDKAISPSPLEDGRAGSDQRTSAIGIHDSAMSADAPKFPTDLQEMFGYNEQAIRPKPKSLRPPHDQEPASKRRHLSADSKHNVSGLTEGGNGQTDIVSNEPMVEEPVAKAKKRPAKSSRTVTGIAIAQFNGSETVEHISIAEKSEGRVVKAKTTKKGVPASKTPLKGLPKKTFKTKTNATTTFVKPIILSPVSLRKRMAAQEVFFGTSSQLALDEPVTAIREFQLALKQSEAVSYAAGRDTDPLDPDSAVTTPFLGNATRRADNGIWSVGARNADDETLYEASQKLDLLANESFVDIDAMLLLAKAEDVPQRQDHVEYAFEHSPSKRADINNRKIKLRPSAIPLQRSNLKCIEHITPLTNSVVEQRALVHTETHAAPDAQKENTTPTPGPATQVEEPAPTNTEPKPKQTRKRKTPKAILDAEATAKKRRGRPRKQAEPSETAAAKPVKKPRAKRAKKTAVSKAESESQLIDLEEIEDSEPEPSSPPRRTSPAPPQALELSPSKKARKAEAAKARAEAARVKAAERLAKHEISLFPLITKAVKAGRRSTDPQNPSWYEKMLLYDPIVLEDLNAWLNDGPLKDAGWNIEDEDDEVEPLDVQNWCEKNSVCCIWRDSLKGWRSKRS